MAAAAAQMVASRYIDDGALAEAVSRRRVRTGQGPARIAQDLRRRGVGAETVDAAVAGLDPEEVRREALSVGRRVVAGHPEDDARTLRQRVGAALQRRGHTMDVIHHVLRSLEVPDPGEPD
ncbi:MAG: regulatory protein RecX [Candidatus Dormibacteria bacterium]